MRLDLALSQNGLSLSFSKTYEFYGIHVHLEWRIQRNGRYFCEEPILDIELVNTYNVFMVFIKGQIGYWTGKKRPDISEKQKGRRLSKAWRKKLSEAHKGKKLSEEHKRKLILKLIGRPVSEKTRRKIGDANRGEKSGSWKGNKVKYRGLHTWIVYNWGKANICENCNSKKFIDWHNMDNKYKRDRKDWKKLCRKCHMILDGRKKND